MLFIEIIIKLLAADHSHYLKNELSFKYYAKERNYFLSKKHLLGIVCNSYEPCPGTCHSSTHSMSIYHLIFLTYFSPRYMLSHFEEAKTDRCEITLPTDV